MWNNKNARKITVLTTIQFCFLHFPVVCALIAIFHQFMSFIPSSFPSKPLRTWLLYPWYRAMIITVIMLISLSWNSWRLFALWVQLTVQSRSRKFKNETRSFKVFSWLTMDSKSGFMNCIKICCLCSLVWKQSSVTAEVATCRKKNCLKFCDCSILTQNYRDALWFKCLYL